MSTNKVVDLQPARKPGLAGVWVETVGAGNSIAAVERPERVNGFETTAFRN